MIASTRPVKPPIENTKMKPIANSMGTVKWMSPRHNVSTQLYTLSAVGTASASAHGHDTTSTATVAPRSAAS